MNLSMDNYKPPEKSWNQGKNLFKCIYSNHRILMKHLSIHTMHTNDPHTIQVSCNVCLSFRDDLISLHGTCSPAELILKR